MSFLKYYYDLWFAANSLNSPQAETAESVKQCRFRLDTDSSATVTLPDGRKLGYAQYGSLTGKPIICCHGHPGSRLEAASIDDIAQKHGARIISVERPGFGWSSPQPGRTILDHAKDIEFLTNHLGLERYGVWGTSGGGPFAHACAYTLPADKLKAVAVVVGIGPPDMSMRQAQFLNWVGFTIGYRFFPSLSKWWMSREPVAQFHLPDEKRLELVQKQIAATKQHPKDMVFLGDTDRLKLWMRSIRESYAQGMDAFAHDGKLMSTEWGFRIEDIRKDLPFHLWYAKLDVLVPWQHGPLTAQRLGPQAELRVEDETHGSLFILYQEEILKKLLASI